MIDGRQQPLGGAEDDGHPDRGACERCGGRPVVDDDFGLCQQCCDYNDGRVVL